MFRSSSNAQKVRENMHAGDQPTAWTSSFHSIAWPCDEAFAFFKMHECIFKGIRMRTGTIDISIWFNHKELATDMAMGTEIKLSRAGSVKVACRARSSWRRCDKLLSVVFGR